MQFDLFGAHRIADLSLEKLDRIRFLGDDHPPFTLDAQGGALLEPAEGEIPPGALRAARRIAQDLVREKGRNFRYVVRSGMHKEIRRGDVLAAARWGQLLTLIAGESEARAYLRRIVFEETRAADLAADWRGHRGLSAERMIRQLAAAPRKWLLPARLEARCDQRLLAAYGVALAMREPLTPRGIDAALERPADLDALYALYWRVQVAGEEAVTVHFREALARRAAAAGGPAAQLAAGGIRSPYAAEALLERLAGVLDPGADARAETEDVPLDNSALTVPPRRDYLHDPHTRPGFARLAAGLPRVKPGQPPPAGIDLRWSGMMRGVLWRAQAAAQGGPAGLELPWEAVDIPAAAWAAAWQADAFFYAELYRQAGILDVPFPRRPWGYDRDEP